MGYQPTLGTEMGELQERITSTSAGAVTSIQAIYVPADDYTDPAPASAFAHLDSTVNLERSIADKGIYPAVDPLASSSRVLAPEYIRDDHYRVARQVQQILQRYRDLQDIIAILGIDELSEEDKIVVGRGFAQMVDNRLTLLTEQARGTDEVDLETARQTLKDAQAMSTDDAGYDDRQAAIQRARAQVKLVEPDSPF